VPSLYALLRRADPRTNKAPFFDGKSFPMRTAGRRQLWPVARFAGAARWIYSAAYTPPAGPPIIFKEVTFIKPIRNLLERTAIPVVYLVRNPCATVLSEVKGQSQGRKATRQARLRELLAEHRPALAEQFPQVVAGTDFVSRTALLWRCEVEACLEAVRRTPRALLLTYEQLASDAYRHAREIFGHFGLAFGEQTIRYLDSLHGLGMDRAKGPRRTGWGRKYFSVLRNPREEKDFWKRQMPPEMRRKIESIVRGNPDIEHCAMLGQWW